MILYGHHESGHAFKVALALALGEIPYEFRWVDLQLPREMRPSDIRAVCKFGEVPALIDDGRVMIQSNAILLHLAHTYRCSGGKGYEQYALAREWLFWEANRVGFALANPVPLTYSWLRTRTSS